MMTQDRKQLLKAKNRFMLFVLLGLCLLFYGLSIVKMTGN